MTAPLAEKAHEYREVQRSGFTFTQCRWCEVNRFDAWWEFIVTWDPALDLPWPILRLFRARSSVNKEQGRATHRADAGHSAHYVRAVNAYLDKNAPERKADVVASALELPCDVRLSTETEHSC